MQSTRNQQWAKAHPVVNVDLVEERGLLNFNQEQLAELLWGGKEGLNTFRNVTDFHANDPILQNTHHYYDMTREEKMEHAYMKTARLITHLPVEVNYKNIMSLIMIN